LQPPSPFATCLLPIPAKKNVPEAIEERKIAFLNFFPSMSKFDLHYFFVNWYRAEKITIMLKYKHFLLEASNFHLFQSSDLSIQKRLIFQLHRIFLLFEVPISHRS